MRSTSTKIAMAAALSLSWATAGSAADARKLVLVDSGVSLVPVVIFKDAPPLTRAAAEELVEYIEKTSGAKPKVIEGEARPVPDDAIWVECQPTPTRLFPKIDTDTTRLDCASTQRPKSAR